MPGLGQIPGIVAHRPRDGGVRRSSLWLALRRPHPSFWGAPWAALACYVVYIVGVWFGARARPERTCAVATASAGRIATTWFGVRRRGVGARRRVGRDRARPHPGAAAALAVGGRVRRVSRCERLRRRCDGAAPGIRAPTGAADYR